MGLDRGRESVPGFCFFVYPRYRTSESLRLCSGHALKRPTGEQVLHSRISGYVKGRVSLKLPTVKYSDSLARDSGRLGWHLSLRRYTPEGALDSVKKNVAP